MEFYKVDATGDDSGPDSGNQSQNDQESTSKRARVSKRGRKSITEQSNSDDGHSRSKVARENDTQSDSNQESNSIATRSDRNRQKTKQNAQQHLLAEQLRVEQRVQQEQQKLKQQELLQQQKLKDELRQQQLRASNEDISNLRTNPNISMRELFPGEEEMGLHVNLPFGSSWRTPDGWTKVTSTVQYDEPTRKLWEELQKPYGNQSSFLRHLLLLEKYFRNGDLLLTSNANLNALTYAESVQHRLQAYDNIPPRPISITQLTPQQQATIAQNTTITQITTPNKAITISKIPPKTQTTATASTQPAITVIPNPKQNNVIDQTSSLLKSNPTTTQLPRSRNYTVTTEPINADKSNPLASKTDFIKLNSSVTNNTNSSSTPKNKTPGLPPELICITSTPNDKQPTALAPPPSYAVQMQLTLQQQIQQQHQNSLLLSQHQKQMIQSIATTASNQTITPIQVNNNQVTPPKKQSANTSTNSNASNSSTNANQSPTNKPQNLIRLPDSLSEAERRDSKSWRPTLMPLSTDKTTMNSEIYLTADGRRLPYFVQVQSGGKPYMISINDYNRMCILRRERLLRDQEMIKNKNQTTTSQPISGSNVSPMPKQTSTVTSGLLATVTNSMPNNTMAKSVNSIDVEKITKSANNMLNNSMNLSNKVQIPNKILEQNSLIPINNKSNENLNTTDSLLKARQIKNQSSLLKSNAVVAPSTTKSSQSTNAHLLPLNMTATMIAPNSAKLPLSLANALSQSNVVSITPTPSIPTLFGTNASATIAPPIHIIPNTQPITITNVTAPNQANVSALEALFKTTNQVTPTPTLLQWAETLNKTNSGGLVDQSASSILSKIPKSLTVIPQQKRLSKSGDE